MCKEESADVTDRPRPKQQPDRQKQGNTSMWWSEPSQCSSLLQGSSRHRSIGWRHPWRHRFSNSNDWGLCRMERENKYKATTPVLRELQKCPLRLLCGRNNIYLTALQTNCNDRSFCKKSPETWKMYILLCIKHICQLGNVTYVWVSLRRKKN